MKNVNLIVGILILTHLLVTHIIIPPYPLTPPRRALESLPLRDRNNNNLTPTDNTQRAAGADYLQALLSRPLVDGRRPYEITSKLRGIVKIRHKDTAERIADFPAAVPTAAGGLAVGRLLERATYRSTLEWGFRGQGHTTYSDVANRGIWAINHLDFGTISQEPIVIMDRVQTDEGTVDSLLRIVK